MADKAEPIIKNITDQIGKLTLVADRDGQVVGAPHRASVGQWFKPGKPDAIPSAARRQAVLLRDRRPHKLEAHLILDQSDINLLRPRQQGLAEDRRQGRGHLQEPGSA